MSDSLIEIYATHSMPDAQILIDLFKDQHIDCASRTIQPAQFPLNIGAHGEHRVLVHTSQTDKAVALIRQAIADGALQAKESEILV